MPSNDVLRALRLACERHPDQRVAQVIVNALGNDPFYVEDNVAAELLFAYNEQATPADKIVVCGGCGEQVQPPGGLHAWRIYCDVTHARETIVTKDEYDAR